MQWRDGQASRLEQAKQLATELVQQSQPSDQFSVCIMADQPRASLAAATVDRAAVRKAIAAVQPTDGRTDLAATLPIVDSVLTEAQNAVSPADRCEVIFFSDLTANAWQPLASSAQPDDSRPRAAPSATAPGDAALEQRWASLADQAVLSLVDVGEDKAANVAVTRLRIDSGTPTLKQPVRARRSCPTARQHCAGQSRLGFGLSRTRRRRTCRCQRVGHRCRGATIASGFSPSVSPARLASRGTANRGDQGQGIAFAN